MMGLVRLALRRPYTSAIVAFIIMLGGAMSITRMIVDIFPVIDIPVTLGDVAKVGGSFANQTNIVHVNGDRATYVTILRHVGNEFVHNEFVHNGHRCRDNAECVPRRGGHVARTS